MEEFTWGYLGQMHLPELSVNNRCSLHLTFVGIAVVLRFVAAHYYETIILHCT